MNADSGTNIDTGAKAGACAGADVGVLGANVQSDPVRSTEESKGGDCEPRDEPQVGDVTPSPATANADANSSPETTANPSSDAAANMGEDPNPDTTTNMDTSDQSMATTRTETSEKEGKNELNKKLKEED